MNPYIISDELRHLLEIFGGDDESGVPATMPNFLDTTRNNLERWWNDLQLPIRDPVDISQVFNILSAQRAADPGHVQVVEWHRWDGYLTEGKKFSDLTEELVKATGAIEISKREEEYLPPGQTEPTSVRQFFYGKGAFVVNNSGENGSVVLIAADPDMHQWFRDTCQQYFERKAPIGTVFMMCQTRSGPEFVSVGVGGHELERANYLPEQLETYDRIKSELAMKNPHGRLHLISGPPGSGKTYIIRGLLQEVTEVAFIIVPSHALVQLADPSSLSALTNFREEQDQKPIVLIVEDADECLVSREEGNISAISSVLNIGDGIVGSVLDVRILATTNALHQDLDAAIKRPGRLSTEAEIGTLPPEKANEVFARLTSKPGDFTEPATLAAVYQKAYDNNWRPVDKKKKRVGFGV